MVRHSLGEVLTHQTPGRRPAAVRVRPGHRVATLAWASHQHLEAYYAIPSIGAVLHTLNLRLHHDDLAYIVNDADDRVLIVDESLLDLWDSIRPRVKVEHVLVTGRLESGPIEGRGACMDYEEVLAATDPSSFVEWEDDERHAAAMCYTSGTTGRPKGVLYSHRALVLHSMAQGLRDALALAEDDTVLPIVPMFHVNAWGLPFTCAMLGCNQVFPGPFMDPKSVLELLVSERVTSPAALHRVARRSPGTRQKPRRATSATFERSSWAAARPRPR